MRLDGKVAIITGVGSGMGRAMANLFADEGAKIVACDWNQETLNDAVSEINSKGGEALGLYGNIAVQSVGELLIDTAVERFGRCRIYLDLPWMRSFGSVFLGSGTDAAEGCQARTGDAPSKRTGGSCSGRSAGMIARPGFPLFLANEARGEPRPLRERERVGSCL